MRLINMYIDLLELNRMYVVCVHVMPRKRHTIRLEAKRLFITCFYTVINNNKCSEELKHTWMPDPVMSLSFSSINLTLNSQL